MDVTDFQYISHTYNYNSVPPIGTGSHTEPVKDTVLRSIEYANKNPFQYEKPKHKGIELTRQCQRQGVAQVTLEPQGFFHLPSAQSMIYDFCTRYSPAINTASAATIEWAHKTSIGELGKGRQTLDVTTGQCVKASAALERFCRFLKKNGMATDFTLMSFCEAIWELFEMEEVKFEQKVYKRIPRKYKGRNIYKKGRDYKWEVTVIKETLSGLEKNERIFEMLTTFATFRKDGERNKSKKRAIASPGIMLRALFRIVEEFGKNLCKNITESTITTGGEEKKDKIQAALNQASTLMKDYDYVYLVTGDNTKWNEGMSSELFIRGLRSMMFFFTQVKDIIKDKASLYNRTMLMKIFKTTFTALFHKKVQMGSGKRAHDKSGHFYKYITVKELCDNPEMLKGKSREDFTNLARVCLSDGDCLVAPGMLMGMLNVLSTFVGLLGLTYNCDGTHDPEYRRMFREGTIEANYIREDLSQDLEVGVQFATIPVARSIACQSSDDFFVIVMGKSDQIARDKIRELFSNCKVLGVNWSPSKTIIRERKTRGIAEYTSWFICEDRLIPQWGSDTAQMRPGGMNCQSDLASGTRAVLDKLSTRNMNYMGADMALKMLKRHLRILYNVKLGDTPMNLPPDSVCFANGGTFKFTPSQLHLDETSMILKKWEELNVRVQDRINLAVVNRGPETSKEKIDHMDQGEINFDKYVRRLVNPSCPLNNGLTEQSVFDLDTMSEKQIENGVILNCNNVQLRSNRKLTNKKEDEVKRREVYGQIGEIASLIRPSMSVHQSNARMPLKDMLQETLRSYQAMVMLQGGGDEIDETIVKLATDVSELLA